LRTPNKQFDIIWTGYLLKMIDDDEDENDGDDDVDSD
jgi:hypothetical protein